MTYEDGFKRKLNLTEQEEIVFFKEAKKLIQEGYGREVCKELNFGCSSCRAQMMIGWINEHLELLEWSEKQSG